MLNTWLDQLSLMEMIGFMIILVAPVSMGLSAICLFASGSGKAHSRRGLRSFWVSTVGFFAALLGVLVFVRLVGRESNFLPHTFNGSVFDLSLQLTGIVLCLFLGLREYWVKIPRLGWLFGLAVFALAAATAYLIAILRAP
jgi:hypothetical protein